MSILKRFNKYMLEHHPLTWHSKFIQLLLAGVLFWGIAYLSGYALTNLNVIKHDSVSRFYLNSHFVSFHVIYCLSVICIWAIYFYKNNAIKSFYPLQPFYLVRLFLQLFVAFALLVSADIPFTAGSFAKTRSILPEQDFEKAIDQANLAAAFLVQDNYPYYFTHREEVRKLNYESLRYKSSEGKWEESFEYYYYPEYLDSQYIHQSLLHRNFADLNDSNATIIDGQKHLFFSTTTKYGSKDSCISYKLIEDFHKLDHIPGLHLEAMQNYNTSKFRYLRPEHDRHFHSTQVPKIHRWAADHQKDSIRIAIRRFMDVMDKYDVRYNLNPELIATYLEATGYINVQRFLYQYGSSTTAGVFAAHYPEEMEILSKYADGKPVREQDKEALIYAMEHQDFLFYNSPMLDSMFDNYEAAYKQSIFREVYVALFLAFFMAWLFIFFEFANIISVLITIPIGGVIAILVAVLLLYINTMTIVHLEDSTYDYHSGEKISIVTVFITCLLILAFAIAGCFIARFNKKVLSVLINLSYVIAPGFLLLTAGMINLLSGHYVTDNCDTELYTYDYSFLIKSPWLGLLYCFIGVFTFFPLVVKWRAREE